MKIFNYKTHLRVFATFALLFAVFGNLPIANADPVSYQVNFYSNGGLFIDNTNIQTAMYVPPGTNALAIAPSNPYWAGHAFLGWAVGSSSTTVVSSYAVNSNTNLYAQWGTAFDINFYSNGGIFIDNTTIQTAHDVPTGTDAFFRPPSDPIRDGYRFIGWAIGAGSTTVVNRYVVTTTTDIYAQWTAAFTLNFYSNGGEFVDHTTVQSAFFVPPGTNALSIAPSDPVRAGNIFLGWGVGSTSTTVVGSYAVNSNTDMYALWESASTVNFYSNGGIFSDNTTIQTALLTAAQVRSGIDALVIRPGDPTRAGYKFIGWAIGLGNQSIVTSYRVPGDTDIYAQWSLNAISFPSIAAKTYGDVFSINPTATSGLPVAVFSDDTSVCTVSGLTVTATGVGICTLTATQSGDANFDPAASQTQSFSVRKKSITVTTSSVSAIVGSTPSSPTFSVDGLVSAFGDSISGLNYIYSGAGTTYYPQSASVPTAIGRYQISATSFVFSTGALANYSVNVNPGILTLSGVSTNNLSSISLKSSSIGSNAELLSGFNNSTTNYSIFVGADTGALIGTITRPSGSLLSVQVRINDSGARTLSFSNNVANTGSLPLPLAVNTIVMTSRSTDLTIRNFIITVYRDTPTLPTGGTTSSPTPTATPVAANQAVSAIKFLVNSTGGSSEVNISPAFNRSTYSYTASFLVSQSATQLQTQLSGSGATVRFKLNDAPFIVVPSTGLSNFVALNKGVNTGILRITSTAGSSQDYTFTLTRASS